MKRGSLARAFLGNGRRTQGVGGIGALVVFAALSTCSRCDDKRTPTASPTATPIPIEQQACPNPSAPPARHLVLDPNARDLVVDATGLYWISRHENRGRVLRANSDGTASAVIAANVRDASAIALDATDVYWAAGRAIFRAKKPNGRAQFLLNTVYEVTSLTVDDSSFYWIELGPADREDIKAADKRKLVPRTIATKEKYVGVDGLQVSNGAVFWLAREQLRTVARQGAPPTNYLDDNTDAFGAVEGQLAVSAHSRLWLATAGTPLAPVAVRGPWPPDYTLRLVAGYVYGSENGWRMKQAHPARLWRVAATGGCPQLLATFGPQYFNDFAVFGNAVYWTDAERGGVFSVGL
jgi:hypothetical protein